MKSCFLPGPSPGRARGATLNVRLLIIPVAAEDILAIKSIPISALLIFHTKQSEIHCFTQIHKHAGRRETYRCAHMQTHTMPEYAGTHPDIRSSGFISVALAPDIGAPIGWLWARIHNEGLKWDVSEESDASCFVFLARGGRGRASYCASENDIPLCESAQQSRTNQARHAVNLTVE